ncbi:MAG: orotate phosphoribosyltransferase [Betaproteobacteria bacterium]|nr:MAG: orotate phosphoribosyltransferase [Betaproteobacteria bacterium]
MADFRKDFIAFCVEQNALKFGQFVTKSGRTTPYFFNAGLFNTGAALGRLAQFYANAILASGVEFDMLFGPAYKGIVLAAGAAIALAREGHDVPFAFDRKEAKDHGEGGKLVGAPLAGRVLIVDDVLTAGTAVRESFDIIEGHGAIVAGVVISLDRMERGEGDLSAVREIEQRHGIPVISIASLDDLMSWLKDRTEFRQNLNAIREYRQLYGVAHHA